MPRITQAIINELRQHAPFTAFGALSGILFIGFFSQIPKDVSYRLFYTFHPLHVFLSALVTAAIYSKYKCGKDKKKCGIFLLLVVGYLGSLGVATLSDSLIPYLGEVLLDMPRRHLHIGFIEQWWLVNPLAFAGILVAYFKPATKFPHFGHVLLSTWASLFHIMLAQQGALSFISYIAIGIFLFLAVWLPCCVSDIVFPLLFIKDSIPTHKH